MLSQGIKAPDFTLQDADGNLVSLSDYIGKKIVLYFYPRDNTPGCTKQACAFATAYDDFKSKDIDYWEITEELDDCIKYSRRIVSITKKED